MNSVAARSLSILCGISAGTCLAIAAQIAPLITGEQLKVIDFSTVVDAPTQIVSVSQVEATADTPAYCHVEAYVAPQVGFTLLLPLANWNGKFLEQGNGGFGGSTDPKLLQQYVRRGYSCCMSNMGHRSTGGDAKWAFNNPQAKIDHGFRAAHVTALAGKAMVERFYGRAPNKSYFIGESTGGRQAMIEAQRFPWDFDGIVAIAPSINLTSMFMNVIWDMRTLIDEKGRPILGERELRLVNEAVLGRYDLDDGIKDGLIGNPLACKFNPAELIGPTGLTAAQAEAVQRMYAGAMDSGGRQLTTGGLLPGSELAWDDVVGVRALASMRNFIGDEFRYMAFMPDPGPGWQLADFNFDRDHRRFGLMESLTSGVHPDLRKFKAAGGKLLMAMGWNDPIGGVRDSVDYYELAMRTMGGRQSTQDFFRLFMIPGMRHGGGEGAYLIDYLSYIETWVEQATAPDKVIGVHPKTRPESNFAFPVAPEKIAFSRPFYPYPIQARYSGNGDSTDSVNFIPVDPATNPGTAPTQY